MGDLWGWYGLLMGKGKSLGKKKKRIGRLWGVGVICIGDKCGRWGFFRKGGSGKFWVKSRISKNCV